MPVRAEGRGVSEGGDQMKELIQGRTLGDRSYLHQQLAVHRVHISVCGGLAVPLVAKVKGVLLARVPRLRAGRAELKEKGGKRERVGAGAGDGGAAGEQGVNNCLGRWSLI